MIKSDCGSDAVSGSAGKSDQLVTFFKTLYGDYDGDGHLIIWTGSDRRSRCYRLSQFEEAAVEALELSDTNDVYFAVGLQGKKPDRGRGSADGVIAIPGLWCDIDIKGPGHTKSNLPEDQKAALKLATGNTGLSPTLVVHSGGGIHVYWLFKEPWVIETEEDRQEAQILVRSWEDTLRQHAREQGYHLDSTSDLARVLRVPFTLNHKDPESPVVVQLLGGLSSGRRYNPADFEPYLINREQVVGQPAYTGELDPADGRLVEQRCPFIRHCVADAQTLDEPSWYAMLTIAARCSGGNHLAHQWSEAHPKYDRICTEAKFQHAKEAPGPYTCEYISKRIDGTYCKDCEYCGRVKSPVVLGREISDDDIREGHIEALNRRHAVVMVEGRFLVINEVRDHFTGLSKVTFSTPADFTQQYRTVMVPNPRTGPGQNREITLGRLWLDSPNRRQYDGLVFSPQKEVPGMYNLWRGFGVRPKPGKWDLFRKHIRDVVADGDAAVYEYIVAWMAHLIQKPGGPRPGTSIVLRGKQGTGKGIFVKYFGKLFGPHFLQVFNQGQITGRFNTHLKDALLVNADEAFWAGDKRAEGVIKGLITEPMIPIEPKGKDIFYVRNLTRWVFTTNNMWAVPAGLEERRFFTLDVSDRHQQDKAYFKPIIEQMENGGCEAMLYDLMHMDISGVDLRKFPRTAALMDQIVSSMLPEQKFWYHLLREGSLSEYGPAWKEGIRTKTLYENCVDFAKSLGVRFHIDPAQFGLQLKRLCPGVIHKKKTIGHGIEKRREGYYLFPPLKECRSNFEALVSMKIDWHA